MAGRALPLKLISVFHVVPAIAPAERCNVVMRSEAGVYPAETGKQHHHRTLSQRRPNHLGTKVNASAIIRVLVFLVAFRLGGVVLVTLPDEGPRDRGIRFIHDAH
jgi:hypothetical protein